MLFLLIPNHMLLCVCPPQIRIFYLGQKATSLSHLTCGRVTPSDAPPEKPWAFWLLRLMLRFSRPVILGGWTRRFTVLPYFFLFQMIHCKELCQIFKTFFKLFLKSLYNISLICLQSVCDDACSSIFFNKPLKVCWTTFASKGINWLLLVWSVGFRVKEAEYISRPNISCIQFL